jgi:predicted HTH domain antitoxin
MLVSVELPDPIAKQLHLDGEHGNRRALEIFALEGYRNGELSRGQVSELLGLEFNETMEFLKAGGSVRSITVEEFEQDAKRLRELLAQ